MSSLRADFLAVRYAETCGKGASRKKMSYRGHPFKSGNRILQKKQARVANALSVKDLEKLNDHELTVNCCQKKTFGMKRRRNGIQRFMGRSQSEIA